MFLPTGGGSESESKYPQWKRVILGIDQYISLPDSIGKLHAACADKKTGAWLSNLESSGWLTTVEAVLTAAVKIAEQIDTHGWFFDNSTNLCVKY